MLRNRLSNKLLARQIREDLFIDLMCFPLRWPALERRETFYAVVAFVKEFSVSMATIDEMLKFDEALQLLWPAISRTCNVIERQ